MENRFGLKDLITSALLLAILVTLWLAMKQYDRQWEQLRGIKDNLAAQAEAVDQLQRTLRRGVPVAGPRNGGSGAGSGAGSGSGGAAGSSIDVGDNPVDPFYRLMLAKDQPDYAVGDWFVDAF